jgi:hypothetical protein
MAQMGSYCKAYPIERFREFSGWSENSENARKETQQVDGREVEAPREINDFLYLQEDYRVTDGIFLDENVIFDQVTPEWITYCKETLEFEVPADETSAADDTTTADEPAAATGDAQETTG